LQKITTATAAVALGVDRKSLDNILAREARHLLPDGRQGRSRRLPVATLETLAIALILNRDIGIPVSKGIDLAESLRKAPNQEIGIGRLGKLHFDVAGLRPSLSAAIDEAIEEVHPRRRGRPPSAT
jgi:hypothetical protein